MASPQQMYRFSANYREQNLFSSRKNQNDTGTYPASYSQESMFHFQGHKADISRSWFPTFLQPR